MQLQPSPLQSPQICTCTPPASPAAAGLDVSTLHQAMALIGGRQIETEASGNVTLDTVRLVWGPVRPSANSRQPLQATRWPPMYHPWRVTTSLSLPACLLSACPVQGDC